jgi:hypothetical protein
MFKALVVTVGLLALPAAVQAQELTIKGIGSRQCKEWTAVAEGSDPGAKAAYLHWLQGYLSGMGAEAMVATDTPDVLKALDDRASWTLMHTRCRADPEQEIFVAASQVFDVMKADTLAKVKHR